MTPLVRSGSKSKNKKGISSFLMLRYGKIFAWVLFYSLQRLCDSKIAFHKSRFWLLKSIAHQSKVYQKKLWPSNFNNTALYSFNYQSKWRKKNENQCSFCTHSGVDMYQYYWLTLHKLGQHNTFLQSPYKGKVSYRVFINS